MSAVLKSYRWSDKPVAAKQSIAVVLLGLVVLILGVRFRAKFLKSPEVHAFTQSKVDHARGSTAEAIAKSGSVPPGAIISPGRARAAGGAAPSPHRNTIQERPLFDGLTATLEAENVLTLSSNSGEPSVEANVLELLPGDGSANVAEGAEDAVGAKLYGQFQSNFDTKRMQLQFRELVTADGRHYAVTGAAMDLEGQAVGVPADYSSGIGLRILGATLGTALNTAEVVVTSRVIENEAGQEALMSSQLTSALTASSQGATSTLSEEATRDLKSQRAVLSLPPGTHFRVKLKASPQGSMGAQS